MYECASHRFSFLDRNTMLKCSKFFLDVRSERQRNVIAQFFQFQDFDGTFVILQVGVSLVDTTDAPDQVQFSIAYCCLRMWNVTKNNCCSVNAQESSEKAVTCQSRVQFEQKAKP